MSHSRRPCRRRDCPRPGGGLQPTSLIATVYGARAFVLALALSLPGGHLALPPAAAAETATEVHGADAVFAGRGVAIVWGVLRGIDEAATSVVIRVVSRDPAVQAVAVDLVDPFSGKRVEALVPSLVGSGRAVRIPRTRFAPYPRIELLFAGGVEILASGAASFTVYFTGVPDTTPEFPSETALAEYLESGLARATGR